MGEEPTQPRRLPPWHWRRDRRTVWLIWFAFAFQTAAVAVLLETADALGLWAWVIMVAVLLSVWVMAMWAIWSTRGAPEIAGRTG